MFMKYLPILIIYVYICGHKEYLNNFQKLYLIHTIFPYLNEILCGFLGGWWTVSRIQLRTPWCPMISTASTIFLNILNFLHSCNHSWSTSVLFFGLVSASFMTFLDSYLGIYSRRICLVLFYVSDNRLEPGDQVMKMTILTWLPRKVNEK